MANFTTWNALYTAMLDKLAAGDAMLGSVTTPGGKSITYKSNKEFLNILNYVEAKAKEETTAPVTRTYIKDSGRGTMTG